MPLKAVPTTLGITTLKLGKDTSTENTNSQIITIVQL